MRKRIKAVSVLIAVVMLIAIFSGCQRDSSTTTTTTTTTRAATTTTAGTTQTTLEERYAGDTPLTDERVSLTWVLPASTLANYPSASNDLPIYQKITELTNVEIKWENIEGQAMIAVINARIAAGNIPDISALPPDISTLVRDDVLVRIDDYMDDHAPHTLAFHRDNPVFANLVKYPDGHIYYFAGYVNTNVNAFQILYNKVWLEKLGLSPPDDLYGLYTMLQAFKENDMNGNGELDSIPLTFYGDFVSALGSIFDLEIHLGSAPGFQANENGEVICDWITPNYKDYLEFLNKLYNEELIDTEYLTNNLGILYEKIANDQVGAVIWFPSFLTIFSGMSPHTDDDSGHTQMWTLGPPIRGTAGRGGYIIARAAHGGTAGIMTKDENKIAVAVRLMDWLFASPEYNELKDYGLEGVTYRVENGEKVLIQPEDGTTWAMKLLSLGGIQPTFPHKQSIDSLFLGTPEWYRPLEEGLRDYYKMPSIIPIPFTSEELEIFNRYNPDIQTYLNEAKARFITGLDPLNGFENFVTALKRLGLDELTRVYQTRYDRYVEMSADN